MWRRDASRLYDKPYANRIQGGSTGKGAAALVFKGKRKVRTETGEVGAGRAQGQRIEARCAAGADSLLPRNDGMAPGKGERDSRKVFLQPPGNVFLIPIVLLAQLSKIKRIIPLINLCGLLSKITSDIGNKNQ